MQRKNDRIHKTALLQGRMAPMGYHVHITPKNEGLSLNLKEVWEYRDLIYLLVRRRMLERCGVVPKA